MVLISGMTRTSGLNLDKHYVSGSLKSVTKRRVFVLKHTSASKRPVNDSKHNLSQEYAAINRYL